MAITITQTPTSFLPGGNPLVFTFTSTATANANFSFYCELWINGTLHSTHQVYREYNTAGRFDASPYIRAVLESELVTDGSLENPYTDAYCTYYLKVFEKWGTPATVRMITETNSATVYAFNGSLRHPEWIAFDPDDYDASVTQNSLFLTSFPRSRKYLCGLDESMFLGALVSGGSASTMFVELYDIAGSVIASDNVALTTSNMVVLNVGPQEIIDNTTITSGDFANCYRYYIYIDYGGVTSTETFWIYIDRECKRYATKRLFWLNKFGVWDSFTFTLVSQESTNVETSTYSGEKGEWSSTATYSYPIYKGERKSYAKTASDRLILNSDWIKEDIQQWLVRELYESPKVYLETAQGFEPVVLTNQSYTLKQKRKDGLLQEQVQIDRTYTYTSQLN